MELSVFSRGHTEAEAEAAATEAAAVVLEEAAAVAAVVDVVAVVEPLPPTQVILRFLH